MQVIVTGQFMEVREMKDGKGQTMTDNQGRQIKVVSVLQRGGDRGPEIVQIRSVNGLKWPDGEKEVQVICRVSVFADKNEKPRLGVDAVSITQIGK